jgi:hypothetical protein
VWWYPPRNRPDLNVSEAGAHLVRCDAESLEQVHA